MSTATGTSFSISIAEDFLSATIRAKAGVSPETAAREDIISALEAAGVVVNEQTEKRIDAYWELLGKEEASPTDEFVISSGRPPVEGKDGTFTWEGSLQKHGDAERDEDDKIDYYDVSSIITVEAGARLGRITAPTAGEAGVDVRGKLLPNVRKPREIVVGDGVEIGEDGVSAFATIAGRVTFERHTLSISEVVEIAGDVDFEVGNLDLVTDVSIRGTVLDLFRVKTTKNITVMGAVEAAELEAGGDVTVRGGILGHEKGRITAQGAVSAKFCDAAKIRAEGDIRLSREAINSELHTERKLVSESGSVIGGSVYARRGVEIGTLGSDAGVLTTISVGLHPDEVARIKEETETNKKRRISIDKTRDTVAPLLQQLKRLNPEQREKATELMFRADELELQLHESEQAIEALLASDTGENEAYVQVNSRIQRRVMLSFSGRVVEFQNALKGPIRIERRKRRGNTVIVAVHQISGSEVELNSYELCSQPITNAD